MCNLRIPMTLSDDAILDAAIRAITCSRHHLFTHKRQKCTDTLNEYSVITTMGLTIIISENPHRNPASRVTTIADYDQRTSPEA